jgi:hypothetical protein
MIKEWAKDPVISNIMKYFRQSKHGRKKKPVVEWDLRLVLDRLSKPPFEPLDKIDIRLLSYKTLFLFALASISRRGEIHAITRKSTVMVDNGESTFMFAETDPSFIFKTAAHLAGRTPSKVAIEGLKYRVSDPEEMMLCPVRAMIIYLRRSKGLRFKGQKNLFAPILTINGVHKEISKATVSNWIRKTISMCLSQAGVDASSVHITAHSVRRAGASIAFSGNIPLQDILDAGSWVAQSTFTSFYLAPMAPEVEGRYRLGPVSAARSVVALRL